MSYILVNVGFHSGELDEVQTKLADGYVPVGGPFVVTKGEVFQAMMKPGAPNGARRRTRRAPK